MAIPEEPFGLFLLGRQGLPKQEGFSMGAKLGQKSMEYVVSFRVNRQEKEALETLAHESGLSLSGLMRTKLDVLIDQSKSVRSVDFDPF